MAGRNDNRDIRSDVRGQIREFLTMRRARISPGQAAGFGQASGGEFFDRGSIWQTAV